MGSGLDRVNDTDFMTVVDEVTHKVIAVVGRRFKNDDEAVIGKSIQMRRQPLEANSVISELNGLMSSSLSEDMAEARWLSLAMSMPM